MRVTIGYSGVLSGGLICLTLQLYSLATYMVPATCSGVLTAVGCVAIVPVVL